MPQRREEDRGQLSVPGAPERVFGFPENMHVLVLDGFHGLNTKATRTAINDQESSVLDNWMPLGENNLRTLYDVGAPIYTATTGHSVSRFHFGNIGDTAFAVVVESDGKLMQVNTTTLTQTSIAPAGTVFSPSSDFGNAQWGSQYNLMCAPQTNGYFIWDGTVFYQAGGVNPQVVISDGGLDYTTPPLSIQAVGGHGSGASFSAVMSSGGFISTINVTNAGTGYTANDGPVYLAFTGGGSTTSAIATANLTGGVVSSITVNVSGSGYNPVSAKVQLLGGGGTGATATCSSGVVSGSITQVVVTNSGAGYTSSPTVIFTDSLNPVAQATVVTMPFGVQGSKLDTFSSRVFVVNGGAPSTPPPKNLFTFSAPGTPSDFASADGAGAVLDTSSFLRVGYHALKEDNGFLYLLGDSCVNYISGVTTAGNPAVTTFNKQNTDPQVGCPWPDTVQIYARSITFANTYGVHVLYGGAVQKVSTNLDNLYTSVTRVGSVPTVNGIIPSGAVAIIFGIHVYMLLLPVTDAISSTTKNKLMMWDGQKWWTAQPSKTLTFINSQEVNSQLTAYGTDGTSIYPLFQTASTAITKVVQSKLWDKPSYFMTKNAKSIFGMFKSNDTNPVALKITIDTEAGSASPVNVSNLFQANWVTTTSMPVTWTTTSGAGVTWQAQGFGIFGPLGASAQGNVMGETITTTATDVSLISTTLVAEQYKPNL